MFEHMVLGWNHAVICTIGLLRKLQNTLSRLSLMTIYEEFIRPHLDYGDVLYDQTYSTSFHPKLERTQYNACLTLARVIHGISKEERYQESNLEWIANN